MEKVFLNISSLIVIHTKIVKELEENNHNFFTYKFADVLFKHCESSFERAYTNYCERSEASISYWSSLVKLDAKLGAFEDSIRAKDGPCKGLGLKDWLIKPVQRVCKYPLLLRELHATCDFDEEQIIQKAQDALNLVLKQINKLKDASVNFDQLTALAARLEGFKGSLLKPNRKFLRETKVTMCTGKPSDYPAWTPQHGHGKAVVLVLLNDTLLICQEKKQNHLKIIQMGQLRDVTITDAPKEHPFATTAFMIEVQKVDIESVRMFFFEKPSEKGVFWKLLKDSVANSKVDYFAKHETRAQMTQITDVKRCGEELTEAILAKDPEKVKALCKHPDVAKFINQPVPDSRGVPETPLYTAAKTNAFTCMIELLQIPSHTLDVNQQSVADHQSTALHAASFKGFSIPVALLLSKGGNPSILNAAKMTARQEARGEAVDVYSAYRSGGIPALISKYPILVSCVNPTDISNVVFQPHKEEKEEYIRVVIVSGSGLAAKDSNGLSDPYCVVKCGSFNYKTKTIKKTLNPSWNEGIVFPRSLTESNPFLLTCWDSDFGRASDYMGEIQLSFTDFVKLPFEQDFTLIAGKSHSKCLVSGTIKLSFSLAS